MSFLLAVETFPALPELTGWWHSAVPWFVFVFFSVAVNPIYVAVSWCKYCFDLEWFCWFNWCSFDFWCGWQLFDFEDLVQGFPKLLIALLP